MNAAIEQRVAGLTARQDGCIALSGDLFDWLNTFDRYLADHAQKMGAADYRFPALLPASDLEPISYLQSFPHLATFAVCGRRDDAALRKIARCHGKAASLPVGDDLFAATETLLTPAACYHFYPRFAGRSIAAPLHLTTRGQCFRCEDHYIPLQRQWSFEMREFVCIGDGPAVDDFVTARRSFIAALIDTLGICADWQPASDPFFDPQSDPKAVAQMLEPVKEELCIADGLAIASVNRHRAFFGESYDIRIGGSAAQSACVAFGLERWLHAMLVSHGPDVVAWPAPEVSS